MSENDADATLNAGNTEEAPSHIPGLPDALVKATYDNFMYALGLRTGEMIVFESAIISDDGVWVHLIPLQTYDVGAYDGKRRPIKGGNSTEDMIFERGIDVCISDIVWCADAPWGS